MNRHRTPRREPLAGNASVRRTALCQAVEPLETRRLYAAAHQLVPAQVASGPANLNAVSLAAAVVPTGSIHGVVYDDANKNGQRDPGESGLYNVKVTINHDGVITQTRTDIAGVYGFANLSEGSYRITAGILGGRVLTQPAAGLYNVTLTAGQDLADQSFGEFTVPIPPPPPPSFGSITGTLWNDADGDGQFDHGEKPTGVRTVFIDTDDNGILDAGEPTTQSNAAGVYRFDNVPTGIVYVNRLFPINFRLSNPTPSNGDYPTYGVVTTVLANKTAVTNLGTYGSNKAPVPPNPLRGNIVGTLWSDINGDGIFEPQYEAGIGDRTVFIDTNRNGRLDAGEQRTKSDRYGHFAFVTNQVGVIAISRVLPANYFLTNASPETAGNDLLVNLVDGISVTADLGSRTRLA